MERKVIHFQQIEILRQLETKNDWRNESHQIATCNDGTVWKRRLGTHGTPWTELDEYPPESDPYEAQPLEPLA